MLLYHRLYYNNVMYQNKEMLILHINWNFFLVAGELGFTAVIKEVIQHL